jgi:hypothetical protein
MVEESYVIKKEIKFKMLQKTFPELVKFLEHNNNNLFKGQQSHLLDALNSIHSIYNEQKIIYKDAFFVMFALSQNFCDIELKVKNNELDFSYLVEEEFWENGTIDLNASIFFAYTFLNELYKEELIKDFKELENLETSLEYMEVRKNIINKS